MAQGSNPFEGKSVPGSIAAELAARGDSRGLKWSARRFPWIQVTSLASNATTITLGSDAGALYETGYRRPNPIVTSVDVKKQGELGTTRRATIKIIAFTDEQLGNLTPGFLNPGMGCRVEWGWSISATGTPSTGPIGLGRSVSDAAATSAMKTQGPIYDGLQGIIASFSYNLTKENTWDITIEVIAAAEAFIGTKVSTSTPGCDCTVETETTPGSGETQVVRRSLLYTFFKQLYDDYGAAAGAYSGPLSSVASIDGKSIYLCTYNYEGVERTEKGADDSSWYDLNADTTEAYISWSALEAAINLLCVPRIGSNYALGRLSSTNMKLKTVSFTTSSDPRVCVIPGTKAHSAVELDEGSESPGGSPIELDNIMVNTVFLMTQLSQVEQGDGMLKTFLVNVLNEINNVCGRPWDLQVVATTEDNSSGGPVLTIIDAKQYKGVGAFSVPSTSTNSAIRDIKLDMKLTDAMKTQALYASGGPGAQQGAPTEGGGNCGSNIFKIGGSDGFNLAVGKITTQPPCVCQSAGTQGKASTLEELIDELKDDVSDTTTKAVRAAIEKGYAELVKGGSDSHCKGMTLPFEFSFTADGIGGFAFGQMVTSDRIPDAVKSAYDFQVTAVEHSITAHDWTTTVNTICRYR